MIREQDVFRIGQLGHPHGLRGEIDFRFTDDVFDRLDADYLICRIDGLLVPFFLEEWRFRSNETALLKFEGLESEDEVRILQNAEVYFPKSLAEQEAEVEITSWKMLTGFTAFDAKAGLLGTIQRVDESSMNILLEILTPEQEDLLLPIHPDLVSTFDASERTITLSLPEGLLSL